MGGTIAPPGGSPVMQVPLVGGASGGGPIPAASTPPPPIAGGGPAAGTDLASAIAALTTALEQLSAAIQAMQGATQVAGGGGPGQVPGGGSPTRAGCGCGGGGGGGGGADVSPVQYAGSRGANAAPTAPPATSPGDDAGGSVRDKIVQAAKAELAKGVQEDAGEDNDKAGNIKKYRSAVTGPGENPNAAEPWCADFASWVWKQAGVPFGKGGQGEDYTVAMIEWARKNGSYHARGSHEPKPGDLVMIDWGGGQDVDHVAVVTEVKDGKVHTIGGNESNGVKSASYSLGDAKMMGFITPAGG